MQWVWFSVKGRIVGKLTPIYSKSFYLKGQKLTITSYTSGLVYFIHFSVGDISNFAKRTVRLFESPSYLIGVTATELRRSLLYERHVK